MRLIILGENTECKWVQLKLNISNKGIEVLIFSVIEKCDNIKRLVRTNIYIISWT